MIVKLIITQSINKTNYAADKTYIEMKRMQSSSIFLYLIKTDVGHSFPKRIAINYGRE